MRDTGREADGGGNAEALGAARQQRARRGDADRSAGELRGNFGSEGCRDVVRQEGRQAVLHEDLLRQGGQTRAVGRALGRERGIGGLEAADLGEAGERVFHDAAGR